MNKFQGPNDSGFKDVAAKIAAFMKHTHVRHPVTRADKEIRKSCYNEERLRIKRLSGQLLNMDKCYINLAISEKSDITNTQDRSETDLEPAEDSAKAASPFSLAARLKVERSSAAGQVQLQGLFNERGGRNGEKRRPSRVLIRGRARVGKTTLCKKIVHDFIHRKMWHGLYDRILWVPLRNLKQADRQKPGYNLGDLLIHEFLDVPHSEPLASAL
jgi:hypothetical protein